MIVPVMAISNLELTRQIYSEQTNGAHAHYREPVPLRSMAGKFCKDTNSETFWPPEMKRRARGRLNKKKA